MEIKFKFDHLDNKILKQLTDASKLGYFVAAFPYVMYEGLRTFCEKYHIELQEGAEVVIMQAIAERLKD